MRERLGRVLSLLQATPLPVELIDDPARTGQWLVTLGNLHQAVILLRNLRPVPGQPIGPLAAPSAYESRGERVMRAFNRMIDGLPQTCLSSLSPIIKLGLIRPLLAELETLERRLRALPLAEVSAFTARLTQYRNTAAAMAARHMAPDPPSPPLRPPVTVPAR
ncbi:MAG: hypothetical protein OJJ21_17735 [Ferrovibrio sp.]|uniref:hypothetical protein n=1 Tax=Ferrovibrio sp. TaxID=1917215 RepID=UPI002624A3D4|nr:hypothetical protein [Ferrovibrio sp.]MCW0235445.1 hypothetical protein [Ferrovibrio sp.]